MKNAPYRILLFLLIPIVLPAQPIDERAVASVIDNLFRGMYNADSANVASHRVGQKIHLTGDTLLTKISHGDK